MSDYALKLSEAELGRYQLMARTAAGTEGDMWKAAGIVEGAVVADVGCGPGAVSVILGELVGPTGRVFAVDRDAQAVEAARAAVARAGLTNVRVGTGDAHDTGLAPGTADVVMIRHVLAHNGGREEAIVAHAAELVRPGGSVYLVDVEARGVRSRPFDPDLEDLSDRYIRWHDGQGNDLSVGLRLDQLLVAAGLEVVDFQGRYHVVTVPPGVRSPSWAGREALRSAGLATDDDLERWNQAFERLDRADPRPLVFTPFFSAWGRRPAAGD